MARPVRDRKVAAIKINPRKWVQVVLDKIMARPVGLEPTTPGVGDLCSTN